MNLSHAGRLRTYLRPSHALSLFPRILSDMIIAARLADSSTNEFRGNGIMP